MILSIALFILAVVAYSAKELQAFNKLKWSKNDMSFWGFDSYLRKYKVKNGRELIAPKDNRYYKFFKIKHREKWFTSATLTVALTDGFHLMQFFFKLLFCVAFYPLTNWWFPILIWLLWTIVWNICDKYLTK